MLGDSNASVINSLEDSLAHRMETLQEVLMGEMNPLDRRLELAGHRPGIVFGATGSPLASTPLENEVDQSDSPEESERESSAFETSDNVEVKVESPSEDALRVADFLAEKHSNAETIVLKSEDTIEVRGVPGGTFSVEVTEVLEREFGEDREAGTTSSSTPSMTAAAKQHS